MQTESFALESVPTLNCVLGGEGHVLVDFVSATPNEVPRTQWVLKGHKVKLLTLSRRPSLQ